jgi:hypothetical protein
MAGTWGETGGFTTTLQQFLPLNMNPSPKWICSNPISVSYPCLFPQVGSDLFFSLLPTGVDDLFFSATAPWCRRIFWFLGSASPTYY